MNVTVVADTDNFYKLVTEQKILPEEVLQFPGLRSSPIQAGAATVAHLLLFPTKLRMFEFLVSSEARQLAHLQFYDRLLTSTTGNMKRVSEYLQGVDSVRTEAHSLANLSGGADNAKGPLKGICERLENLLTEKECEAEELRKQLEEAKVAVMEANAKTEQEVKAREALEVQLDEIHQLSLSMSSSFLE